MRRKRASRWPVIPRRASSRSCCRTTCERAGRHRVTASGSARSHSPNHGGGAGAIGLAVGCSVVAVLPSFLLAGLALAVRDDIELSVAHLGVVIGCFYGAAAIH